MKKSKIVSLVLISAALSSCGKNEAQNSGATGDWDNKKVYMRSDTSATYTRTHHHGSGIGTALLWYYAFRPYGSYNTGMGYQRAGFYSGNLHSKSNVGTNATKSDIVRGGFGGRSFKSSGG